MPYVVSTLAADNEYTVYVKPDDKGGAPNVRATSVLIKGGAGVAQSNNVTGLHTPEGRMTFVTDAQLEALEQVEQFRTHRHNGFIKVMEEPAQPKVEKAAKDMNKKDTGKQLVGSDFEPGGRAGGSAAKVVDPKAGETKPN